METSLSKHNIVFIEVAYIEDVRVVKPIHLGNNP